VGKERGRDQEEHGDEQEEGGSEYDEDVENVANKNTSHCVGGLLSGRPARALQSRASFLNGKPSYLLYFWEVADTHQLLQSSLQRLNSNTGASDASFAPSTSSTSSGSRGRNHRQQLSLEFQERQQVLAVRPECKDFVRVL
jgi:hypothetical protein